MAILASLFGALGRFAGKIVNAALGWASLLLFGRVPRNKQILLSVVTLGSIVWVIAVLGVLLPDVGAFLIAAIPAPKFIDRNLIRLVMFFVALFLPLVVGTAALFIVEKSERPSGKGRIVAILRGYPFCLVLAFTLSFLGAIALVRKGRALVKRWEDAHVPIVLKPGGYDRLVADLCDSLDAAGLGLTSRPAPRILALPAHVLAAAAGSGVKSLVPDRLMEVVGGTVEILVYPSDIAVQGTKTEVARARAAIASRLTTAPAYLTTSEEAQKVEDRIESISRQAGQARTAGGARNEALVARSRHDLDALDRTLAHLVVPYEEWEVLYRMRLQVERELLTGEEPGETLAGSAAGARGASAPRSGPAERPSRSRMLQWAASGLGFFLVALDVTLSFAERLAPPRDARRRLPWS